MITDTSGKDSLGIKEGSWIEMMYQDSGKECYWVSAVFHVDDLLCADEIMSRKVLNKSLCYDEGRE
jgi:hypothetical protein